MYVINVYTLTSESSIQSLLLIYMKLFILNINVQVMYNSLLWFTGTRLRPVFTRCYVIVKVSIKPWFGYSVHILAYSLSEVY